MIKERERYIEVNGKAFLLYSDDTPRSVLPGRELDILVALAMGWTLLNLTDEEKFRAAWLTTLPGQRPIISDEVLGLRPDDTRTERVGCKIPPTSTSRVYAVDAWIWLQENNPWPDSRLALMRNEEKMPAVYQIRDSAFTSIAASWEYSHAIALAVAEAGKVMGVIE